MIYAGIKKFIRSGFNLAGFDLVKRKNSPDLTLLGLQSRPIKTIVDVGANNGQFAKKISKFFPQATIYCFEPLPEAYSTLSAWAKTQNERVFPINLAVGEDSREVEMFLHDEHTSSSSLLATTELTEQYYPLTKEQSRILVNQKTLDNALEEVQASLESEVLIKLDVQGFEDRVISGGKNVFAKADACILEISLDTLYQGQARFKELLLMLDDLGYRYAGNLEQVYGDDGHCIFLDAVFLKDNTRIG